MRGAGQGDREEIGVPYYEDRIVERLLGHRPRGLTREQASQVPFMEKPQYRYEGQVIEVWPVDKNGIALPMNDVEFLTEEVWSRDYWPNTADDIPTAVRQLPDGKVVGIYYHGPSMCLVLLHPGGMKLGIRATKIIHPKLGVDKDAVAALAKLKKA